VVKVYSLHVLYNIKAIFCHSNHNIDRTYGP